MTERSIFLSLLEIPDSVERAKYLEEACTGDSGLRDQVQALLKSHEDAGQFLVTPVVEQMSGAADSSVEITQMQATTSVEGGAAAAGHQSNEDRTMHEELEQNNVLAFLQPSTQPGSLGRLAHYDVLEVLGRGAFGTVLKAFDEMLRRMVAIKVMAPELAATSPARKRFLREARASAAARHENIVHIYDIDEQPIPFLVMEYIPGQTLLQRLEQRGPLDVSEVLRLGEQIARGLAAAHAMGLIHRDVKPANILLENGIEERVKITDFGLARAADDASLTQSGFIAGTPMYMAPEQARGEAIDQRTDLFSLGSVLYVMTSGRPPFRASNTVAVLKRVCEDTPRPIREIIPETPQWLCDIISKLHAKHPEDRFQTAQEVADVLARCHTASPGVNDSIDKNPTGMNLAAAAAPVIAAPSKEQNAARMTPESVGQESFPVRMRWTRAAAAGVVLAAAILGLALFFTHTNRKEIERPGDAGKVVSHEVAENEPAQVTHPLDGLRREDIPAMLLAMAGDGNPEHAPPGLVAVLGDGRMHSPDAVPSADGKWVASPSGRAVLVVDAKTGRLHRTVSGLRNSEIIRFSPDGALLAITSWGGWNPDGTEEPFAVVWDVETAQIKYKLVGHKAGQPNSYQASLGISDLAFSPDGTRVATSGIDFQIKVWDANSGTELLSLPHTAVPRNVVFSPDSRHILSGAFGGIEGAFLKVWDRDGKETRMLDGHTGEFPTAAFSPDGKWLVTGSSKEYIVRHPDTFEEVQKVATPASWLAFAPDGRTLFAQKLQYGAAEPQQVTRWDLEDGQELPPIPLPIKGDWPSCRLSFDGKTLFVKNAGDPPAFGQAIDIDTGKQIPRQAHVGEVSCVAIHPAGTHLASGGADHTAKIWNLATGRVEQTLAGHAAAVITVAYSPDGATLATAGHDGVIKLWDVVDGHERQTLRGHKEVDRQKYVSMVAFSPDGSLLASAGADGTVKLWYLLADRPERTLTGFTGVVHSIAFSPDGTVLAAAALDGAVRRWTVADGSELAVLRGENVSLRSVAFHPSGKTLVSGGTDWRICEWDLTARNLKQTVSGHGANSTIAGITHLAWDKTGRLLVSCGSVDKTVRIWNWESTPPQSCVVALPDNVGFPTGIDLTADGRYLAICCQSGLIEILRVPEAPVTSVPGSPMELPDPAELAQRPAAADKLDRKDISAEIWAQAGFGDPEKAPPEVVAILDDDRFQFPDSGIKSWMDQSPDGNVLAVPCGDDVVLFATPSGKRLRILKGPGGRLRNVAFSPDGQLLAAAAWGSENDSHVRVWDIAADWAIVDRLPPPTTGVYYLAFSADSKQLLISGDAGQPLYVSDARSGEKIDDLDQGPRFHSVLSRSGKRIAAVDWNSTKVVVIDAASWKEVHTLERGLHWAGDVAFSRDGTILAAGSNADVRIWNAETWETLHVIPTQGHRLAFSPDGQSLWTWPVYPAAKTCVFTRWDVASGRRLAHFSVSGSGDFMFAEFSRDGKELYVANELPYLRVFDAETGKEHPRRKHEGQVLTVAFNRQGTALASAGMDQTIRLWDPATGAMQHVLTGNNGPVGSVAFSPDGTRLVNGGSDGTVRLWDVATGIELRTIVAHDPFKVCVAYSPDGKTIASAGDDGFVKLWDTDSGKLRQSFRANGEMLSSVAFSPDGKTLAAGSNAGTLRLWDVDGGWEQGTLKYEHKAEIRCIAFHPGGRLLATGTHIGDGTIRLWDLETKSETQKLEGHIAAVLSCAWRADGGLLVSSGWLDGTVRLWDMHGNQPRSKVVPVVASQLHAIALSPEGRHVATANPDGSIYILRLAP